MEIVGTHSQVEQHIDNKQNVSWEAGFVYQMAQCPACADITLRRYYYHDAYPDDFEWSVLYPTARALPQGLPETIQKAWCAAARVKNIDANAFGVLVRRMLELVCADRGATGGTLNDKLADLATKREIPEKLVAVARGLRRLSNVGAHAELGDLTPAEAPILEDLSRAVLEYVYSAPHLASQAEERLAALRVGDDEQPPDA
ncbi:MAG: DUF4145 domain-containing protein [Chloroflexi bacterium]|nr:DUF4145 domain-containing protein [Chloroflexota bacterium]